MSSIFSRIYPYKQTEDKNNLENYLTEIFAFCLQNDDIFRENFLSQFSLKNSGDAKILTQKKYEGFGRPDIEISLRSTAIIIECKIESKEGENQLNDYVNILKTKNKKRKILVYLTKYYETKTINSDIKFINKKWFDIYKLINENCNSFSQQLKNFLVEYKIAMDSNFTTLDLNCLENITDTIAKMDEVIDAVSGYFSKHIGSLAKSSRGTRLKDGAYFAYKDFGEPRKFSIDVGFEWWWSDNHIYLTVDLWIPLKGNKKDDIIQFFKTNLSDWKDKPCDDYVCIGDYKTVNEFVAMGEKQIPEMISFLKKGIDKLAELKKRNPEIFQ